MAIHAGAQLEHRAHVLEGELRRVTAERDAALARLTDAGQRQAVALLASSVAHEVSNPLQGILAYAELLEEVLPARSNEHGYATQILTACRHMRGILSEVLEHSRSMHEVPKAVEPTAMIRDTCALIAPTLSKCGVEIVLELSSGLPMVFGARRQLMQVLTNLIANARDAMLELPPARPRTLTVRAYRAGTRLRIEVDDTGPGIPADRLPHIFETFYSSKAPGKGTGLGLAISSSIVEHHDGRMLAHNLEPSGARMTIELPATERAQGEPPDERRESGVGGAWT